jgi:hypothetical protein
VGPWIPYAESPTIIEGVFAAPDAGVHPSASYILADGISIKLRNIIPVAGEILPTPGDDANVVPVV